MKKTTQIAADRAFDHTKTVLPAEVARGVYLQNAPSLAALKLMHLMIATAGGRMAEPVRHEIRLSDIRKIDGMDNHTRASLTPLFGELSAAIITHDDPEKMVVVIGGLLDVARIDYRHEISNDLLVTWYFGGAFRDMAEKSNHWAILDRQTVFHLGSKYSMLLFQHIASLTPFAHITSKTFTIPELRAVLGVPERKMGRWNDANRFALKPAIAEISQLSRFNLTATPHKIGRTVASVTISWEEKPQEAKQEAKRELDRPKVGRAARRDGTAEAPVVEFPASGSVKFTTPWEQIARANCNWDHGKIADAFRSFCEQKHIRLNGATIEKTFTDFCKKQPRV
jgi:hypothetical protein